MRNARITRTHVHPKEIEAFVRNIQHKKRAGWYRRDWKVRPISGAIAKDIKWNLVAAFSPDKGFYYVHAQ